MSWLAVVLVAEAIAFMYLRVRNWKRLLIPRRVVRFPQLCPACMQSGPITNVLEASWSKTISPWRGEALHLEVPYCKVCGETINRRRQVAWRVGLCTVALTFCALYVVSEQLNFDWRRSLAISIGVCFAICWPLNELWGNRKRALVLRRYNHNHADCRVKNTLYWEALRRANL